MLILNWISWIRTVWINWIVWNRTDICIKMDLALDNQQRLICHKNQPTKQPSQAGCDIRSILSQSTTGFNSELSFKAKEPSPPNY